MTAQRRPPAPDARRRSPGQAGTRPANRPPAGANQTDAHDDSPTVTFEALSEDTERADPSGSAGPDDGDQPTQVMAAVRDTPAAPGEVPGRPRGGQGSPDETTVIPRLRDGDPEPRTAQIPVHRPGNSDRGWSQPVRPAERAGAGGGGQRAGDTDQDGSSAGPAPAGEPSRRRPVLLVAVLLLVALAGAGGAWYFEQEADKAGRVRPASNLALIDKAATAQVVDQVSRAVEAIYSYDATSLDQSESGALSFITGSYGDEFKRNFALVRQLGPQQQAALVSKVVAAGVVSLSERRATLLVMVDQEGRRSDAAQPLKAAVRLTVTAQRVDGQWKVSGVNQK